MRPVNLLPDELRPRQRSSGERGPAHAAIGVLAVVLLMAVVYALSLNQVNSRKTDIARARSDIERANAEVSASSSFGDFHQIKQTRLASVKELAAGRFDWERFMRELALVLPADTWLLGATASTSPDSVPGAAGSSGATSSPGGSAPTGSAGTAAGGSASPTLTLKGCALRQGNVAVMLVRLRKLYRADNVTLRESTQENATSGGAQPSDGAGAGSDNCGARRFKFQVAVTFTPSPPTEKPTGGKVPSRLGGGS